MVILTINSWIITYKSNMQNFFIKKTIMDIQQK
jgi:hypothetical protein